MSSPPQGRNWNVGNKFRSLQSMGKNFQSSMKQTMNGFTGMEKPSPHSTQRSFRSSTVSNMSNDTKSPSGARQYQSGRRRSIDRTPSNSNHGHYKSASITKMNIKSITSPSNKYQKRRKRSLLIGRESFNPDAPSPQSQPSKSFPPNFYPPESFVNLLYRITEMESASTQDLPTFGLAILDIDNLRGHIQSPLQKQTPTKVKSNKTMAAPRHSSKQKKMVKPHKKNGNNKVKRHQKHSSMPHQQQHKDDADDDSDDDNQDNEDEDDSDDDDDSMSASPLSTENIIISAHRQEDSELKYIDDQDLESAKTVHLKAEREDTKEKESAEYDNDIDIDSSDDEYGLSKINPEPKSAAERSAAINHQRRKSSLLLRSEDSEALVAYSSRQDHLAVGNSNMDPYLLFWNNSKKGESVVGVVQDVILMSISRDVKATHFGFGEFAILATVSDESEFVIILKRILSRVSCNVCTQKVGPVTLCGGVSMCNWRSSPSQWVNECRQACRLAKTNGRGRIAHYLTREHRRKLSIELMLEIGKPKADLSGSRVLSLIRSGADLNFQYKYDTPLMIAIKKENATALRYIVQYDYNPNIQDKKGRNALILALERDCDSIILDLLCSKRDLNPRIRDYSGLTALSHALRKGYRDIAKTLILLGSEPLLGEQSVLNEWFSAAKCGNVSKIELMLNSMSFPIDMIDADDMTALMLSCSAGHTELVQYVLSRGANINIQGHRGYTALMFAIQHGKIGVFSALIAHDDVLIGLNGDDGCTVLMCAAKGQMPEVISIGMDAAVDINAQNMDGNTALMIAAQYASVSVATELLRNHCDLDLRNKQGQNALIICACNGSSQCAAMLATLGSRIDCRDEQGKTALMYAAAKGQSAIVGNLIKYGANLDSELCDNDGMNAANHATKNEHFECAKMIKNGTLHDVTDILQQMEIIKQKNSALHKNVNQLTEMNNELSDRINATELQKNQIQKKLHNFIKKSLKSPAQPHTNNTGTPQQKTGTAINKVSAGMSGITSKFNSMFQHHPPAKDPPKPPSKDIKL